MRGEHGARQGAREWDAVKECRGEVPVVKNKNQPGKLRHHIKYFLCLK